MTHHGPQAHIAGTGRQAVRARRPPGRTGARFTRAGNRVLALGTAVVLGATLLSACGGSSDTADSEGGAPTVTVGVGGNIFDVPIRLADTNGYFREQGLKVKYVTLTASAGGAALKSGSVQFLNDSPNSFLSAIGKGVPVIAIAADGGGNPLGLIVSTKFAERHGLTAATPARLVAKALAGSTGGASSVNTKAEAGIFLKAYGVEPAGVKWVSLPSPAADKAALKSGRIDWFTTSEPIPLEIQESGDGIVVADPLKVPKWSAEQAGYGQFVVVRKSYAAQHAATTAKFVTAVQQATNYMNQHLNGSTVQSVAQKALPGIPAPVLKASLPLVEWPRSEAMSTSVWNITVGFVDQLGSLPKGTNVSSDDWTNTYLPAGGAV